MTNTELEHCITTYGAAIYSFCRHLAPNRQEADDLYQDTFLKAVELSAKINYAQNPKSYLLAIALRIWKNKKRKFAWRRRIAAMCSLEENLTAHNGDASTPSLEERIVQQEEHERVRQAVDQLPERFKLPILLYYMEELPIAQISVILKIPDGTVKSRLYQARKQLAKELEVILDEKD